ncbi:MAG: trypsin-like peptidase domain-containing protein [Akkermansiaceae bacterium]
MNFRFTTNRRTSKISAISIAFSLLCFSVQAKELPFNQQKVPKSTEDLLEIQNALVEHLEHVRKATVSISLGKGFGSGVIVSPDGLILTAAHVTSAVDKELTVIMNDGTKHKAVSMGLVSNTDAAMMRITEEGEYPYVEINKDNNYKLSHWVMALGHSGGFDKTRGPVVRLGRIVKDSETTLHTDCKVIGGDSGGPLFDLNGRLIGIHSRVQKSMEQNMHVPMREYLRHWKAMEENQFLGDGPFAKRPVKGSGFLGVGTTEVDEGLLIGKVGKDSAAEKAGLKIGDVIIKINDKKVTKKDAFKTELKEMAEGQSISLTILRKGEEKVIDVKLGKR